MTERERGLRGVSTTPPHRPEFWYRDPRAVCTVCGRTRSGCELVPVDVSGHWFESKADHQRRMSGERRRDYLQVIAGGGSDVERPSRDRSA